MKSIDIGDENIKCHVMKILYIEERSLRCVIAIWENTERLLPEDSVDIRI